MSQKTVATIIGVGPRGLTILERIAQFAQNDAECFAMDLHLIDPGECGEGIHEFAQPAHLITNTVCGQVTIFSPSSLVRGLSFAEWARATGYRQIDGGFVRLEGGAGSVISDDDYLPRRLLGEYLSWAYERIVASLPRNIGVWHHRARAVDIWRTESGTYIVKLDNDVVMTTEFVFLTTGHGRRMLNESDTSRLDFVRSYSKLNHRLAFFPYAYPVRRLDELSHKATIAVEGLGLTAHDVVSQLTVGRGGRFARDRGRLRYLRSGCEPRIFLHSRSGIPFSARGRNQKGLLGAYQARFLTLRAIDLLREQAQVKRQTRQLQFESEIFPLLVADMAQAYRNAATGMAQQGAACQDGAEERAIQLMLDPLRGKQFDSLSNFEQFFWAYVKQDLEESSKGNVIGPIKAAADTIRDLRDNLRSVVDYGGLESESHQFFVEEFVATHNRVLFGPPPLRMEEWLALREAGVMCIGGGPGAQVEIDTTRAQFAIVTPFRSEKSIEWADALILARIDVFSPLCDDSALTRNLLARGMVRPYFNGSYHPGGIEIDECNRVIDVLGKPHRNVWAIGYLVEGPHWYTQALPRTSIQSRATRDAETCVAAMYATLAARGRVGFRTTGAVEGTVVLSRERSHADSDQVAQAFRDDLAHRSDMMLPGVPR
jgi:uncharacterized NAD(P)/FAD-binding protein YdhS